MPTYFFTQYCVLCICGLRISEFSPQDAIRLYNIFFIFKNEHSLITYFISKALDNLRQTVLLKNSGQSPINVLFKNIGQSLINYFIKKQWTIFDKHFIKKHWTISDKMFY